MIITCIVSHGLHITEQILRIPYIEMGAPAYFTTALIIILFAGIYLFVYRLIEIKKGDTPDEN